MYTKRTMIFKYNALQISLLQLYRTITSANLLKWNAIKSKYSMEELQIVFDTLKTSSSLKMKNLGISENQIEFLQNKQEKFTTLDDIVLHSTITVPELINICTSILSRKKESAEKSSIVTSMNMKKKLKDLKIVVGLHIRSNYFSWTHLNISDFNCSILDWDCQSLPDVRSSVNPIEVIKIGTQIARKIPDSDAYVMENSLKPKMQYSTSSFNLMLRQQQIVSTVLTSLSTRQKTPADNIFDSFYMMKSRASAHHFGLLYGNESVSATEITEALFQQQHVLKHIKSLSANDAIRDKHYSFNLYEKEVMNKSLLIALTFIERKILANKEKCN